MQTLVVKKNDLGLRIDNFLKKTYPNLTSSVLYKSFRNKRVKVNNKKVGIDYRLVANDKIELYINDEFLIKQNNDSDWKNVPNEVDIVYEDENILLVNKPVGLVVHNDESKTNDTLINRIKLYLFNKNEWQPDKENQFTPSLVNRIDRNTKGIVIAAKTTEALRILNDKIKNREIDKYYLCHVHGIIDPKVGVLHDYLTRNERTKIVRVTKKPLCHDSAEIITEYKTLSHDKNNSLLEIKLITGKTHQIRAHLAYIGHPLVGERKYTNKFINKTNGKYQDLIAYKIIFNFRTNGGILNYLNHRIFKV